MRLAMRMEMEQEKPVGICPACGEAVFNTREDCYGPVWTCPADLSKKNPYWEPPLPPYDEMTNNERDKLGYFGNCLEDGYAPEYGCECYDRMPLHSACYEKGDY